jgi:hypothetical protein
MPPALLRPAYAALCKPATWLAPSHMPGLAACPPQTPSLVPPDLLAVILETLDRRFGIAAGAEVSLEADPGTFDVGRLRAYKALGVSRLSMGVQSFQQVGGEEAGDWRGELLPCMRALWCDAAAASEACAL